MIYLNKSPVVACIWAQDENGLIGDGDGLLWECPSDLNFYKECTVGNVVIMGRKTYDSMPTVAFKNRSTIVVTSAHPEFVRKPKHSDAELDITFAKSYEKAFLLALQKCNEEVGGRDAARNIFIAGGESIYHQAIESGFVDCVYMSRLKGCYKHLIHPLTDSAVYAPDLSEISNELVEFEQDRLVQSVFDEMLSYRLFINNRVDVYRAILRSQFTQRLRAIGELK